MQGNKLDDQFVDKAWEEMQRLLDRDMPVLLPKKKKRSPFLWLFFLLGFITVSFSAGYWYFNGTAEEQIPEAKEKQPIASQGQEKIPEIELKAEANALENSAQTLSIVSPKQNKWRKSTNSTLNNTPTELAYPKDKEVDNIDQITISEKETDILPNEQQETAEITKEETAVIASAEQNELTSVPNLEPVYERAMMATFEQLPLISTNSLEYHSEAEVVEVETSSKRDIRRALLPTRFGLEGSLITNRFNPIDGYGALAFVEFPLANSKWSLRTGLGYREHTGGLVFLNDDNYSYDYVNTESNTDITNDPSDPNSSPVITANESVQGYRTVLKNVYAINLAYLELPIKASYHLSNRLRAEGGFALSYRVDRISLARKNEGAFDLEFADNFNNIIGAAGLFGNARNNSPEGLVYDLNTNSSSRVRNLDLAASLGLRYHFNSKLAVGMSYNQGFIRVNDAKSSGNLNQNVRLSASYYFK